MVTETGYRATSYEEPIVTVHGKEITVFQRQTINGIAVIEGGGLVCTTQSADLGRLASGIYLVTWNEEIHDYEERHRTYVYQVVVRPARCWPWPHVLFEFLSRYSDEDRMEIVDQAERRVLWAVQCMLEPLMGTINNENYEAEVAQACDAVRDKTD